MTFNGVSLFANYSSPETGAAVESEFRKESTSRPISIHTSTQGSAGSKSVCKAALLAALTIEADDLKNTGADGNTTDAKWTTTNTQTTAARDTNKLYSFAAEDSSKTWNLDEVSMGVFQQALENISFLRAQVGGQMSGLSFAADTLSVQQTNIRAALGRLRMWISPRRVQTYPSIAS